MDRDWIQTYNRHTTAWKHKPNVLSYLSCQFREQAASTVVFKIFHLYSHSTEQERRVGRGGWKETERDGRGGGRITINRIMRQGPVHKDSSLRTVGLQGTTCIPSTHTPLISPVILSNHQKSSLAHKSLFFDLCSNSEPALPSTAGTENKRQ